MYAIRSYYVISDAVNRTVCERTALVAMDKQIKAKMEELAAVGGEALEQSHERWYQRRNACVLRQDIRRCLEQVYGERLIELDWRYHRERIVYQGPIRITSYNVCYTKLLRRPQTQTQKEMPTSVHADKTDVKKQMVLYPGVSEIPGRWGLFF